MKRFKGWFDKLSPRVRRIINMSIIIIVAVGSGFIILKHILPTVINATNTSMSTSEGIAFTAVIVTIIITTINLITSSMNKKYASKKQLSLSVDVLGNKAIITGTVENKGTDRITPKCFYLFINEGKCVSKQGHTQYVFPNILKHECNEFDCALAKRCKHGRIEKIPDELLGDEFKNRLSICSVLQHISSDSVNFIDPGEFFSEDMIFELEPGVYRAILLGVTVEADCMCAHKIFSIDNTNGIMNNNQNKIQI